MSSTVDLHRISVLFQKGAVAPALSDSMKNLEDDIEFDFDKFDEEFEKLIEQEEWDEKDCIRLSSLFFARAVEMKYMEGQDQDGSEETD